MRNNIAIAIVAIFLAVFLLGYNAPLRTYGAREGLMEYGQIQPKQSAIIGIAAIDGTGNGAIAKVGAHIVPGSGRMLILITNGTPLISPETQESMRTGFELAKGIAGSKGSGKDVYYEFQGASEIVSGRSAGAAIAILTLAQFEGKKLRADTLITGSIDSNGSIGRVGFILEKARALAGTQYSTLLVPIGESIEIRPPETCKRRDGSLIAGCKPPEMEYDIGRETGINIVEVATIAEAYLLMTE